MDKIQAYLELAQERIIFFAPKLALAFIILYVGLKIVKKLEHLFDSMLIKIGLSDNLRPFLISMINFLLYIVLFFIVSGVLGIDLTLFASIIAASVFAIGMSLQGSLGNFASGLLVLSLKPYKAEDFIEVDGKFGQVTKIDVFTTEVTTPGNKLLIIPNSKMTSEIVTNYTKTDNILLDITVSIPYEESFPRVKAIILNAIKDIPEILKNPEPRVGITKFESHSVVISVWPQIHPEHFWEATFKVHENIKAAFAKNNVKVAYTEGFELGKIGE